jgi:carbon starvation protein
VLIKSGKARYAWTTLVPLAWLCAVTFTAGWQKVFAADPRLGFLSHAAMIRARLAAGQLPPGAKTLADAHRMIFNDRLDAAVALAFMAVAVLVIVVSIREWLLVLSHRKPAVLREAPFVPSALGG